MRILHLIESLGLGGAERRPVAEVKHQFRSKNTVAVASLIPGGILDEKFAQAGGKGDRIRIGQIDSVRRRYLSLYRRLTGQAGGVAMCGIAGPWDPQATGREELHERAEGMRSTLAHRGPDSCGVWVDPAVGMGLAHRRLSIIDLSSAGAQPMSSASGRWMLTYNGEVYNFLELRARLQAAGRCFRGGSDTEVILHAVEEWGFDAALRILEGMFAFALWDRRERRLHLVRDRLGKKPLYLHARPRLLLFASELKALCAHPAFERRLDPQAVYLFSRYNYVLSPYCIFEGTSKLEPGHHAVVEQANDGYLSEPHIESYWDPLEIAARGVIARPDVTEAVDELEAELRRAVSQRMVADVPLGALLSGGIDSATVVALMQTVAERPVRTFTIGYQDREYDEATAARAIAEHLGTDHTELYVTVDDTMRIIPEMPDVYDEPFGDSSQLPTLIVSRLARRSVAVALAGDGGDELFGGYRRYSFAEQL